MTNRFPKEKFEQVAAENGYEVFTPEQIASYYKEGIQKSMNDKMSEAEKKEFIADCMYLSKAVLVDKDGTESTVYFRKSQVDWEKAEDGTIMKGVAGVYADTPANRLLGRVGEAYVPDADFMKSLDNDTEGSAIAKAARTGRYADTPENRRLHRVGQPYKKREGKGGQEKDEGYDSPAIAAGNSRHALESALGGKLKWNEVDDGVYAIEGGEDGRNKQLGNFGITIDMTDKKYPGGKVTLYDVESGDDIKTVNGNSYNAVKKLGEEIKSKVSGGSTVGKESDEGSDKKLPEGWKKSIRVVDDEDSWNAALEDAMGSKEYNKVFTEDLAQDEDAWFKKMEEMVPKYMSSKQVQTLIDEVGTETEDDD